MSRPTIRRGSSDRENIHALQDLLTKKGFKLDIDGFFGPGTEAVVRQFQASNGLGADGIVGRQTWAKLEAPSPSRAEEIGDDSELEKQKQWAREQIPTGIPVNRRKVIEAAIEFLGADEIPDGSNWGPEVRPMVEGYNEYWKVGSNSRFPWCMMACSTWIGIGLGLGEGSLEMDWSQHPFKAFFGGAAQCEDWAKKQGVFASQPSPGSVFTMARGGSGSDASSSSRAGHVGLVICDMGNGKVLTIEGNVSNGVRCKTRKKADLHGYVEWWSAE